MVTIINDRKPTDGNSEERRSAKPGCISRSLGGMFSGTSGQIGLDSR
ncbi:MAG: hypothetical protein ACE5I9_04925 [Candidatus Methylomirabilales bacterium]